jgi:hypothetical protein
MQPHRLRKILPLLFPLVLITACTRSIPIPSESTSVSTPLSRLEGLHLILTAKDLSENVNRLSTQDDELILLVYTQGSAEQLPTIVFQEYFVLDSEQRVKEIRLGEEVRLKQEITLVLIEMDSKLSIQQVEPVVRLNLDAMLAFDQKSQPQGLQSLLGDDDLLGAIKLETADLHPHGKEIEFKGRRLFDSYHYVVGFSQ